MGLQSLVKHAMANMKKNNVSNVQTGRLWSRRVTEIAADLDRSDDTAKKAKFEQLITTVATEFLDDNLQARTGPEVFLKRQQAIIAAEAQLNEFKAPPSDRNIAMEEAVKKDMQKLDRNLREICESSLTLLKELCQILPSKKALKAGGMPDSLLDANESFLKLQVAMAEVNDRIANLQELGLVEPTVMVTILKLEDPDAPPIYQPCSGEETFGELIEKTFVAPDEGVQSSDDGDEDDILPDVWIKRWDPKHNSVTQTGQWWEHQDESLKIRGVFQTVARSLKEDLRNKYCVELVARKGDYVIALVNDQGREVPRVLDLPTSRKKAPCTHDHLKKIFANHQVARILDLQSGKDASETKFGRISYRPKTNPLYIELKAITWDPDLAATPPNESCSIPDPVEGLNLRPQLDPFSTPSRAAQVQEIFDKLYYRPNASMSHVEIQAVGQDVPAKPLLNFLTIPYVCAQRIVYIAREVEFFNMQSIYIARQALNLVLLLNDFVTPEQAPDDEQRRERIRLGDDLLSLEQSMKRWGAAAGVHEEYEERVSEIRRQYDAFFKERFYYQSAGLNDRTFQNLLDYDKNTIKREQWSPALEREG